MTYLIKVNFGCCQKIFSERFKVVLLFDCSAKLVVCQQLYQYCFPTILVLAEERVESTLNQKMV